MTGVLNDSNVTCKNTYWEARKVSSDKLKKKVATYKMGLVDKLKGFFGISTEFYLKSKIIIMS
jgi:hypothetical protein